jgi:hypothetical protein
MRPIDAIFPTRCGYEEFQAGLGDNTRQRPQFGSTNKARGPCSHVNSMPVRPQRTGHFVGWGTPLVGAIRMQTALPNLVTTPVRELQFTCFSFPEMLSGQSYG